MALGSVGDARLQKEIEELERLFTIDTEKLKKITDHFGHELEKGLTAEGGSIVSVPPSHPPDPH
jgi:hexokinase